MAKGVNRIVQKLLLDMFAGRESLLIGLHKVKCLQRISDIEMCVDKLLHQNNKYTNKLKEQLFPENYEQLNKSNYYGYRKVNFYQELQWIAIIIKKNSDVINNYIKLRGIYESQLMNGEYDKAAVTLFRIENETGYSFWSLDHRFILSELSGGLEKNKAFLKSINDLECDTWTSYLADMFSYKAENGISVKQYNHRIDQILSNFDDVSRKFLYYKVYPVSNMSIDDYYDMLFLEETSSLIDKYITFVNVCVQVCSDDQIEPYYRECVSKVLYILENQIHDITIDKMTMKLDKNLEVKFSQLDYKMLYISDQYTVGNYDNVISLANNILDEQANIFELYEYIVKSHIMQNKKLEWRENILRNELCAAMFGIYIKNEDIVKSFNVINRIIRYLNNTSMCVAINDFFIRKFQMYNNATVCISKEFYSTFYNLRFSATLGSDKEDFLEHIIDKVPNSISTKLYINFYNYQNYSDELNEVSEKRRDWYEIKQMLLYDQDAALKKLIEWYNMLTNNGDYCEQYYSQRVCNKLFALYLINNDIEEAEKIYVASYLSNRFYSFKMDGEKLYSIVEKNDDEAIYKNICTPILVYIFNETDFTKIYSAYANFLDTNQYIKPSDIFSNYSKYKTEDLIFFLRYVCVLEVIDSMNCFEDQNDVENERIAICQFLQQIDKTNENVYIGEISQITQKQKILKGIQYLESYKIDIDTDKIMNHQKELFSDYFKRFIDIGELKLTYKVIDITSQKVYNIYDKKITKTTQYNSKVSIFREIVFDFRNEFSFGQFGLDQSLGTRVRHGRLQNQIRSVFEKYNLALIRKNSKESEYLVSSIYKNWCKNLSPSQQKIFYAIFSDFTKQVDEYIDIINASFLRIKTEQLNPEGLIDFTVTPEIMKEMFVTCNKLTNEETMVEWLTDYWISKTECELVNIQNKFRGDIKNKYISLLNNMETEISSFFPFNRYRSDILESIVKCRTELQNTIDEIVDWFRLPTTQEFNAYTMDSLYETCELINQKICASYDKITFNKRISSNSRIKGYTFSYFTEILVILFSNSFYRSGFERHFEDLIIDFSIIEDETYITIAVSNNLSDDIVVDDLDARIKKIKNIVDKCKASGVYDNFEGGSGYVKICKMLDYYIGTKSDIEFGNDSECFWTKICVLKNPIVEV